MSIEHDSSSRLHSSGVQCRVLLGENPSPNRDNSSLTIRIVSQSTPNRKHWLIVGTVPAPFHDGS